MAAAVMRVAHSAGIKCVVALFAGIGQEGNAIGGAEGGYRGAVARGRSAPWNGPPDQNCEGAKGPPKQAPRKGHCAAQA